MAVRKNYGSGKSAGRHILAEYLGEGVFLEGRRPEGRHKTRVIIDDSMQMLKSFYSSAPDPAKVVPGEDKEPVKNVRQFIEAMKRGADYYLNQSPCEIYVMAFDKIDDVPMAKGEEQEKRTEKDQLLDQVEKSARPSEKWILRDGIEHVKRRPFLDPKKGFPWDFDLAMSDRRGTRKQIISDLCWYWLGGSGSEDDEAFRIIVPPGKKVVIDGHCLSFKRLSLLQCEGLEQLEKQAKSQAEREGDPERRLAILDSLVYSTPVVLESVLGAGFRIYLEPRPQNQLGEADFSMFYLFEQLTRHDTSGLGSVLEIHSEDTDLLYLSFLYLFKKELAKQKTPEVYLKTSRHSWALRYRGPKEDYENWIMVSEAYDSICLAGESKDIKDNVLHLVCAMFNGGGDYVNNFPWVPGHHFFRAWCDHHAYIGPLVKIDKTLPVSHPDAVGLDGDAFVRLVKTAYVLSKRTRFETEDGEKPEDWDEEDARADDSFGNEAQTRVKKRIKKKSGKLMDLESLTIAEIRERTKTLDPRKHFPSPARLCNSALQLLYYLKMVMQVGDTPRLHDHDPLKHGYVLRDPRNPLSASNLVKASE